MKKEELQSIEIPFGAKDSEFVKDEYFIPEGCKARIEGNKVIIEKIQKEELTEFEKYVRNILGRYISNIDNYPEIIKNEAKSLLDMARKELAQDFEKNISTDIEQDMFDNMTNLQKCFVKMFKYADYHGMVNAIKQFSGLAEVLIKKDLPKWKYINQIQSENHYTHIANGIISPSGYFISYDDLETLPKEE